jgi:Trk-type K+ transport system membrane component
MTFTFFFGFFFKGNTSFQSQLFLKDALNESNLGQVFKTLLKIVLFTLLVELVGFYILFLQIEGETLFRLKTAAFHSISAFCNAGFSTYSQGLFDSSIRFNYGFHVTIAVLVILGGLGYPVVFSYYLLLKHSTRNTIRQFMYPKLGYQHKPHVINSGIRLIIITTLWLISFGTILIIITEWNHSLSSLPWYGKVAKAFFAAVTPRTAGFNTIDYSLLSNPTVLITMLLMWIGASPGSTGGGIKTSTFSVAILSALSVAKGKDCVEYSRTELSTDSIRRAFAVILLSILVIGVSIFLVSIFNSNIDFQSIVFECISAFSTVGLSLGITSSLSMGSKIVIILTMFIGRVGALTILIGILRKVIVKSYKYPTQDILIN